MKHKHLFFFGIIGGCLLIIGGVLVYSSLTQPSQGQLVSLKSQTITSKPTFDSTPVEQQGNQVNFEYPRAFQIITNRSTSSTPGLSTYVYSYKDTTTWQLSITVSQLNSPTLNADSSYQFRLSQPMRYKQSTVSFNSKQYVVMTDMQSAGFNEVAYSVNGDRSAEISLSGDDPTGGTALQITWAMILGSWTWL